MSELHKDWIYISGPITGVKNYIKNFMDAEIWLIKEGWQVINPAKMGSVLPVDASWEDFMKVDFVLLSHCSTIYMLPNWEKSAGAKAEMAFARNNGINILYHRK
ncbi:MAG: DUF4406 domain-containing protein [Firmicutes bacterium]|nr:DUF4406 domain-containing protein [Bacillota bacterium]